MTNNVYAQQADDLEADRRRSSKQDERDRLDDAVADAMAAVINRYAMLEEADSEPDLEARERHRDELVARCRELKDAYDRRADFLGYDRSKAR